MWDAPNGKMYFVLPDGNLLLTAENHEPGPTPEWRRDNDPNHDDDDDFDDDPNHDSNHDDDFDHADDFDDDDDFDPADLIDPCHRP